MDGIMLWTEGIVVGKVSEFKTEEAFVSAVREELYDPDLQRDVRRTFCRFYRNAPWPLNDEFPDGAYAECKTPGPGAFEIFLMER